MKIGLNSKNISLFKIQHRATLLLLFSSFRQSSNRKSRAQSFVVIDRRSLLQLCSLPPLPPSGLFTLALLFRLFRDFVTVPSPSSSPQLYYRCAATPVLLIVGPAPPLHSPTGQLSLSYYCPDNPPPLFDLVSSQNFGFDS